MKTDQCRSPEVLISYLFSFLNQYAFECKKKKANLLYILDSREMNCCPSNSMVKHRYQ